MTAAKERTTRKGDGGGEAPVMGERRQGWVVAMAGFELGATAKAIPGVGTPGGEGET
jgi:hypothetical protein